MNRMLTGSRGRRGLTLIELVVVMAILAILAGLVVQHFGSVQQRANRAQAATNMADLFRAIEQYRVIHNAYPDQFDSLCDGATLWEGAAAGVTPSLDPELIGPVASGIAGSPTKLKVATLPAAGAALDKILRSLTRMGITTVMDHGGAVLAGGDQPLFPGDTFGTARVLAAGGSYATLNNTGINADGDAKAIVNKIFKNDALNDGVIPAGKIVMVVGVGVSCTIINPDDLIDVPFYPNNNNAKYYNRFLAVIVVDDGGSRAYLGGIIGADGDLQVGETVEFYNP